MHKFPKLTLYELFEYSCNTFSSCNAIGFVDEQPMSYSEFQQKIHDAIAFLEKLNVNPKDKVAILSQNMPNWCIVYAAITSMGAIAVPLMPEFSPKEIDNVLQHAEVSALFISENLLHKIKDLQPEKLKSKILLNNFTILGTSNQDTKYTPGLSPIHQYKPQEDDIASIVYTSGTTGASKGVMLTHKNICSNALAGKEIQKVNEKDRFLSVLPLSHAYENTIGFILAVLSGSSVYYLRKPPTPTVLLPALQKVKPTVMLTVPLIIEKIFHNKIAPAFQKSKFIKSLYQIGFVRKKLHAVAGKKLKVTFGGELHFFGIGGAKLDKTVEQFLINAKFPYAIGYGLTETAPLSAGMLPGVNQLQSTGIAVPGVEIKVHNPDAVTGEGEIWIKGPNVMKGYYKEPELTKQVLTEDGWFKTGDLGIMNNNNFIFVKGRLKNMILGANGKNIYPEEIESVINNFKYVVESVVVDKKGKLVALVHFNMDELEKKYLNLKSGVSNFLDKKLEELIVELQMYVNTHVNKFSQIHAVVHQESPFQKTATHKIKRFLYM